MNSINFLFALTVFPIGSGFLILLLLLAGVKIMNRVRDWWIFTVLLLLGYIVIRGENFLALFVFLLIFLCFAALKLKKSWWIFTALTASYFFATSGIVNDLYNSFSLIPIIIVLLLLSDAKEFFAKKEA